MKLNRTWYLDYFFLILFLAFKRLSTGSLGPSNIAPYKGIPYKTILRAVYRTIFTLCKMTFFQLLHSKLSIFVTCH